MPSSILNIQFYHLRSTPLERALPKLMEKAYAKAMRAVIVADATALEVIDKTLWTYSQSVFLPHGTQADPEPQRQPIYLHTTPTNPNRAELLVITNQHLLDTPDDAHGCTRVFDMFDGNNQEHVQAARLRWKHYKNAGHTLSYIRQQDDGSWQVEG